MSPGNWPCWISLRAPSKRARARLARVVGGESWQRVAMSSPPGLPEFDLPMIFADKVAGLGFQSGVFRVALAANVSNAVGVTEVVKSGFLILSPEGMLELRSQVDQLLGELERRGLMNLKPDKLDG